MGGGGGAEHAGKKKLRFSLISCNMGELFIILHVDPALGVFLRILATQTEHKLKKSKTKKTISQMTLTLFTCVVITATS